MKEIEFIKSIETLAIRENDILVVKVDQRLSAPILVTVKKNIEERLPEGLKGKVSVYILEPGIDMGVIRKG